MRSTLLARLRCPACHAGPLQAQPVDAGAAPAELRAGSLACRACGRRYSVVAGVPELIAGLDPDTQRERMARTGTAYDPDVERARPYITDPARPALWPSFAANMEQALDLLAGAQGPVADVGCATCWSTRMLAERGFEAVAVDISTDMLLAGEAQFGAGVWFERVAADMANLPFEGQTFGAIVASAAVHHAESLVRVFAEFRRLLRTGGRIVLVNEPVLGLLGNRGAFAAEDLAHGMNEHIYRLWEYERAARAAGLTLRVLPPRSLARQIAGASPSPSRQFATVARALRPLPAALHERLVVPAHLLVGLPLVAVLSARRAERAHRLS